MSLNRRFGTIVADTAMWLSTGTTSNTFVVDSDSSLGKIIIDVTLGAADKSLTLTNTALTDNRTVTFQDADGTVAYLDDITAAANTVSNTFTIDSDSALGKIILDVTTGAADKAMTITNAALTDDRTVTLQNASGTVALTADVAASTGTSANTFTVDSDSVLGKMVLDVTTGAADKSITVTNEALTADQVITLPNATGTVQLLNHVVLTHAMGTNTALATTGADLADGAGGTQYGVFVAPVDIVVTTMYDTLTEAYSKDATDAVIAVKDDTGAVITTRTLTAGGEAAKAHHSTAPGGGPATVTAGTRLDLAITSTGAGGTGHAVVVLEYYVP